MTEIKMLYLCAVCETLYEDYPPPQNAKADAHTKSDCRRELLDRRHFVSQAVKDLEARVKLFAERWKEPA
jgi:hypothetical protein